jgi:hypothetical protein
LQHRELLRLCSNIAARHYKNTSDHILFHDEQEGVSAWIPADAGARPQTIAEYIQELVAAGFIVQSARRQFRGITYPWEAVILAWKAGENGRRRDA